MVILGADISHPCRVGVWIFVRLWICLVILVFSVGATLVLGVQTSSSTRSTWWSIVVQVRKKGDWLWMFLTGVLGQSPCSPGTQHWVWWHTVAGMIWLWESLPKVVAQTPSCPVIDCQSG